MDKKKKELLNKYKLRLALLESFILPISCGGIFGTFIVAILGLCGLITISYFGIIWFIICFLGYMIGLPLQIATQKQIEQLLEDD